MSANEIIDDTVATWRDARPDIDVTGMDLMLRMTSLVRISAARIHEQLSDFGITLPEFDVLATLRRSGAKAELTPSYIAEVGMVKPSGLSHRLARLERAGFISRSIDPDDRRSALIRITPAGRRIADRGIEIIADAHNQMISGMNATDRRTFNRLLTTLVEDIDADVEVGT